MEKKKKKEDREIRKYTQITQAYALHFYFTMSHCVVLLSRGADWGREKQLGSHNKLEVEQESH